LLRDVEFWHPEVRRPNVAVAVIQDFPLDGADRTTTNYDRVQEALGTRDNPPAGGLMHSAGLDDVWESREAWDAFLNDRLMPVVEPMMEQGGRAPETRVYELHDFMA
jgi:hypothetical protein